MKATCERFLKSKKTRTDDEKEFEKAKRLHADAATKLAKPERKNAEPLTEYSDLGKELAVAQMGQAEAQRKFSEAGSRLVLDAPSGLHSTLIEQLVSTAARVAEVVVRMATTNMFQVTIYIHLTSIRLSHAVTYVAY